MRVVPLLLIVSAMVAVAGCNAADSDPPATDQPKPGPFVRRLPAGGPYWTFALSSDGRELASGGDSTNGLWDVESGYRLSNGIGVGGSEFLALSPDGTRAVSIHRGGLIDGPKFDLCLWELTDDRQWRRIGSLLPITPFSEYTGVEACHAAFSPDSQRLTSCTVDGVTRVWDARTGRELLHFPGGVMSAFSGAGGELATVTLDGFVRRWDAKTGQRLGANNERDRKDFIWVKGVSFAAGGSRVAIWDHCFIVSVRDLATGMQLCRPAFPQGVCVAALSPDGRVLAVAVAHEGIWLLDAATAAFRGHWPGSAPIRFSSDGDRVAWVQDDAIVIRDVETVLASGGPRPRPVLADPPNIPLHAELIALKGEYDLDAGDLPENSARVTNKRAFPPPPKVDLELRLRNTGTEDITLPWGGSTTLALIGEGAVNTTHSGQIGAQLNDDGRKDVVLKPNQTHVIRINDLDHDRFWSVTSWALPGDYDVYATFDVTLKPAPAGVAVDESGECRVRIHPPPVRLTLRSKTK